MVITALCNAYYFVWLYQMHSAFYLFSLLLSSLLDSFETSYLAQTA